MLNTIEKSGHNASSIINIDNLADIQDVVIDTALPARERAQSYFRQIKDPYCYKCDDTVVRVSYANTDVSLKDRLMQYLLSGNRISTI